MEFKPIMPENFSSGSSPSVSSSSSSAYSDSDTEPAAPLASNPVIVAKPAGVDSDSDGEGFASGQESFDAVSEMGRGAEEEKGFRPVAKVSNDIDDDEEDEGNDVYDVGGSKGEDLAGDVDGERELGGLLDAGASVDEILDGSLSSGVELGFSGADKSMEGVVVEHVDEKFSEAEGVKFTDEEDAVVEGIQVDVLNSGAVVGDLADVKDSGIVEEVIPAEGSVSLDNGFEPIDSIETAALNADDKNFVEDGEVVSGSLKESSIDGVSKAVKPLIDQENKEPKKNLKKVQGRHLRVMGQS